MRSVATGYADAINVHVRPDGSRLDFDNLNLLKGGNFSKRREPGGLLSNLGRSPDDTRARRMSKETVL